MNKIVGMAFSYSPDSMQYRGLQLLNNIVPFYKIYTLADFDIPLVKTNYPNGEAPDNVKQFVAAMEEADALVFGISEMVAQPYSGFKNAMEWLVIEINNDVDLTRSYCISHKPLVTTTFTPGPHSGARHWDATNQLLFQLNCKVKENYVFRDAWEKLLPGNVDYIKDSANEMLSHLTQSYVDEGIQVHDRVRTMGAWLDDYDKWNKTWNDLEK
tara:strand:+ start:1171 stop:1809 length:639 start_codon:yes stop_codon:yes gene_type:complete